MISVQVLRSHINHPQRLAPFAAILGLFLTGCVSSTRDQMVRTQIVTFPEGHDRVEVNRRYLGTTPIVVTLPQDEKGRVAGTTEIRIIPVIPGRYGQVRIFDGASRLDTAPARLMIDVRQPQGMLAGRTNDSPKEALAPRPIVLISVPLAQSPRGKTLVTKRSGD
jgi:hypothetical protein